MTKKKPTAPPLKKDDKAERVRKARKIVGRGESHPNEPGDEETTTSEGDKIYNPPADKKPKPPGKKGGSKSGTD
jgi:hypothetical protein